jgi:hydroxymethylpyrimidine pyrophosphatase-like HAD family hydrolase
MTNESVEILKGLHENLLFVPITTRTEEEYKRVIPISALKPKFAIVANGGKILVDGEEDLEWKNHVLHTIKNMPFSLSDVHELFFTLTSHDYFNREKLSDDLFWMLRLEDEKNGLEIVKKTKPVLNSHGYEVMITGRKIYIVPTELTKWKALEFLINKTDTTFTIAAGDSLMDLEMLTHADIGITPKHGEIVLENRVPSNTIVTTSEGVLAGLEIVELALKHTKRGSE